jgi:hypothetical protein
MRIQELCLKMWTAAGLQVDLYNRHFRLPHVYTCVESFICCRLQSINPVFPTSDLHCVDFRTTISSAKDAYIPSPSVDRESNRLRDSRRKTGTNNTYEV